MPSKTADMQHLNWNDLRFLLALSRGGSLAAAARQLGVDATTVARRLHAAETALGSQVLERLQDGTMRPTQLGEDVLRHAEAAEVAITTLIGAATDAYAAPVGRVRVTAVPVLVGRILVPAAGSLVRRYPALRLELTSEPRDLSLMNRETDMALRFARPTPEAGRALLTRKLGQLAYAAYAPAACDSEDDATLPWIGYDETMADLPPARWLTAAGRLQGAATLAVNDAEAIIQAVRAGLGRSILPRAVGGSDPGLRQTATPDPLPPLPSREIWLLTHPDLRSLTRINVVTDWLTTVAQALQAAPLRRRGTRLATVAETRDQR